METQAAWLQSRRSEPERLRKDHVHACFYLLFSQGHSESLDYLEALFNGATYDCDPGRKSRGEYKIMKPIHNLLVEWNGDVRNASDFPGTRDAKMKSQDSASEEQVPPSRRGRQAHVG